jgi:hypothetical protein
MWQFSIFESDTNESNFSLEVIKSRLNSGTACYHSVPKFLPACLLAMNIYIKIYTVLKLEEHRLRVFKNMVLRELYGPKREKVARDWRNCITKREKRKTHKVLVWKPER